MESLSPQCIFHLRVKLTSRFFPSVACISHWFRRKRAVAMGIMYSGSSVGGVIWPILMSRLLDNPNIGFKWSLRIAGFINVSSHWILLTMRSQLCFLPTLLKEPAFLGAILDRSLILNSSKIRHLPFSKSDFLWSSLECSHPYSTSNNLRSQWA